MVVSAVPAVDGAVTEVDSEEVSVLFHLVVDESDPPRRQRRQRWWLQQRR